jgi:hypothetical protein
MGMAHVKRERNTMKLLPPRHLVWSTDVLDVSDPFQRRWYIRQVIQYGRVEDIRTLDLDEVAELLDDLHLPSYLDRLWRDFLEERHNAER